jgi:ABC-type polar amino acid transport system ATPase subunit
MMVCRNISITRSNKIILQDVNLNVRHGNIMVVTGPSGGGKSSLLKAMAMIDPPTCGEITVDGNRIIFPVLPNTINFDIWPKITLVFQQLFLWPHMTLLENILFPIKKIYGAVADDRLSEIFEMINKFNIMDTINNYPNNSSIGQRQRAALIRAVVLMPKYLLLDEVTASLDVEHVLMVVDLLEKLKNDGVGIVLVTHSINLAKRIADDIVFIDNGAIIESGNVSILNNPNSERFSKFLDAYHVV